MGDPNYDNLLCHYVHVKSMVIRFTLVLGNTHRSGSKRSSLRIKWLRIEIHQNPFIPSNDHECGVINGV